jgi:hypothetical protein
MGDWVRQIVKDGDAIALRSTALIVPLAALSWVRLTRLRPERRFVACCVASLAITGALMATPRFTGEPSQPDPTTEKIVLFLTDGQPTLPAGPGFDSANVSAVLRAAERARRAGIRFHAFAIGPEALAGPVAAVELAARTGGYFTPVRNPGDIVEVVEQVRFSNVESVTFKNLSTGETAKQVMVNADGSFGALVPLQSGLNRIQVSAVADDGSTADQIVQVSYVPGTAAPVLPRELMAQRNRLLEQKLVELRRERADTEREAVERTRKELALEIERDRAKANEQAERQRKELQLEVEKGGSPN